LLRTATAAAIAATADDDDCATLPPLLPTTTTTTAPVPRSASKLLGEINAEMTAEAKLKFPSFKAGDAIEVKYMQNKTTKKVQLVRGVVLGKSNKGLGTNFKMRNIIGGIPVEWQYALYSPLLKGIRVLQEDFIHKGKKRTRRSKIYYLRDRPDSWSTVTADFAKAMTLKHNSAAAKAAAAAKKAKTVTA
jgi:large subunit ribosomal protein L19